mgnify:CR=1 FL=1
MVLEYLFGFHVYPVILKPLVLLFWPIFGKTMVLSYWNQTIVSAGLELKARALPVTTSDSSYIKLKSKSNNLG